MKYGISVLLFLVLGLVVGITVRLYQSPELQTENAESDADKTIYSLPLYNQNPPLRSYTVPVKPAGGSFVRVDRTGSRTVHETTIVLAEADYVEASPGATLVIPISGQQVTVSEKSGVSVTRLRAEDTMLTLSMGTLQLSGIFPGRVSVQAGNLLIEISKNVPVELSVTKEAVTTLSIRSGAVKAAYVDQDNETRVVSLRDGETGVFTNGDLRIQKDI